MCILLVLFTWSILSYDSTGHYWNDMQQNVMPLSYALLKANGNRL